MYQDKYPNLRDIYEKKSITEEEGDKLYAELIKMVAFEAKLGISTHIRPDTIVQCQKEA